MAMRTWRWQDDLGSSMHQRGHYNNHLGELGCLSIGIAFGYICENEADHGKIIVISFSLKNTCFLKFTVQYIRVALIPIISNTYIQVYAATCLILFLIIHVAIELREYYHKKHIQSIYKHASEQGDKTVRKRFMSKILYHLSLKFLTNQLNGKYTNNILDKKIRLNTAFLVGDL